MTQNHRHLKPSIIQYGKPDGWDHNNGFVAFWKHEDVRGVKPKKYKRKKVL